MLIFSALLCFHIVRLPTLYALWANTIVFVILQIKKGKKGNNTIFITKAWWGVMAYTPIQTGCYVWDLAHMEAHLIVNLAYNVPYNNNKKNLQGF